MNRLEIVSLLLGVLLAKPGAAATWEVPEEAPSIGAALALCSAGDTVLVNDGVYAGPDNRNLVLPAFDVVLLSRNGPSSTTVDCEEQGRWIRLNAGQTRSTLVAGFRVIHANQPVGGAISIGYASPTIQNCELLWNHGGYGGALVTNGPDVLIEDCRFRANDTGMGGQGGAVLVGLGQVAFVRCVFEHNRASFVGAVTAWADALVRMDHCTISGNLAYDSGGAIQTSSAQFDLRNCIVYGNECLGYGPDEINVINQTIEPQCCDFRFAGVDAEGWTLENCFDADPLFCDAADWQHPEYPSDYHLRSDSPCLPQYSPCGMLVGALDQGCLAPTLGACCFGPECQVMTAPDCAAQGGVFLEEGLDCEPNPCGVIPVVPTTWGRIKATYR